MKRSRDRKGFIRQPRLIKVTRLTYPINSITAYNPKIRNKIRCLYIYYKNYRSSGYSKGG